MNICAKYLFIQFYHYGLRILTFLNAALSFSFHDSMHVNYDAVKSFSLLRFSSFIFQYSFSSYDLSILSPFDLIL